MKRFFQKNGIMMLAAVVVVAVGLCIASAVSNQTGFLQNAAGVVTYPFRAAGSAVTGWFQSIGERFQTVESLRKENEDLRKENAQLTEDLRSGQDRQRGKPASAGPERSAPAASGFYL